MSFILHQLKTDVRHFRWWLISTWLSFALEAFFTFAPSFTSTQKGIVLTIAFIWQIFNGVFLVVSLVQADSLVSSDAAWLTRPLRREHLFWAKSLFVILLILLPMQVLQSAAWISRGYTFHLWLCSVAQLLLIAGLLVLVAGALASLTRNIALFFLAAGIGFAITLASIALVEMLRRADVLHGNYTPRHEETSFGNSQATVAMLLLAAAALGTWVAQGRWNRARVGTVIFALGLAVLPYYGMNWRRNFLRPHELKTPPLTVVVSTNAAETIVGQRLSSELVVQGVPDGDIAVVEDITERARFGKYLETDGEGTFRTQFWRRNLPVDSWQKDLYFRAIKETFPSGTLWFNDDYRGGEQMAFGGVYGETVQKQFTNHPPAADIEGTVSVDLFKARMVAELPLQRATINALPGQAVTIQKVRLSEDADAILIYITESIVGPMFDRDMEDVMLGENANWYQQLATYVLYDPTSQEAFVVRPNRNRSDFPNILSSESYIEVELTFPYPALRQRLTGRTTEQWMTDARLCVFLPIYDGSAKCPFKVENYHPD